MSEIHAPHSADDHGIVSHHFTTLTQEREALNLGIWSFLITEVMFFGALFGAYFLYRLQYPNAWLAGSQHMNVLYGGVNTGVLLGSSLTMALAVHAAEEDHPKLLRKFLWLTIFFGAIFLGIKCVEYHHKYVEHLMPGVNFRFEEGMEKPEQIFFFIYFALTGLHAFHMVIGMVLMLLYIALSKRGKFTGGRYMPVHILGLYWHFVDIVWIFIFPLLYLIGPGQR